MRSDFAELAGDTGNNSETNGGDRNGWVSHAFVDRGVGVLVGATDPRVGKVEGTDPTDRVGDHSDRGDHVFDLWSFGSTTQVNNSAKGHRPVVSGEHHPGGLIVRG
jgi:hypothetical protein